MYSALKDKMTVFQKFLSKIYRCTLNFVFQIPQSAHSSGATTLPFKMFSFNSVLV